MKFLHAMLRVRDPKETLHFYCELLGLQLLRKADNAGGRFTLYFLATAPGESEIELTHNWDPREYTSGDNFGHLAFRVDDIYALCARLEAGGVRILRPPRDGHMAFVKDPNGISLELLQAGDALPRQEPWASMPNSGSW